MFFGKTTWKFSGWKTTSTFSKTFQDKLLFLHNTGLGGCYVYGGLTLYHHTKEETDEKSRFFMHLTEDEATSYISIVPSLCFFGTNLGYTASEYFGRKLVLIATNVLQISPFILISEITTIKQRAPLPVINIHTI